MSLYALRHKETKFLLAFDMRKDRYDDPEAVLSLCGDATWVVENPTITDLFFDDSKCGWGDLEFPRVPNNIVRSDYEVVTLSIM